MNGPKISAFVLARDEEDRIESCLRSIAWADERIVIVDDKTMDETAAKAAPLATDVVVHRWEGFSATKRFACSRTKHPWVLWIDADEVIDARLAQSIRAAVADPSGRAGFRFRRRNYYLGREIGHGAWSNDVVLRLFHRDAGRFDDRIVHESAEVDGGTADLDGFLEHRSYRDLAHHLEKLQVWSKLWTLQAQESGKRASPFDLLLRPPTRFVKGYLLKMGFLDGKAGLILAFMDAAYVGMKYARLLEAQLSRSRDL